MRLKIKYIILVIFSCCILISCEKDNITNTYFDENPNRMEEVSQDLRKAMVSSPNGWVMMVKTSLSPDVYTPVVLKFDTTSNEVNIRTVYGPTDIAKKDYFRIANGTGSPQLIFTTGSIMTSLYRVGAQASDVTDHIYNVIKVSSDTIEIQPYRSGNVYAKEGGVIYKLFKRPDNWIWAEDTNYFDFTNASFSTNILGVSSSMKFEYVNTPSKNVSFTSSFGNTAGFNLTTARNGFQFAIPRNIGTGGFGVLNYITMTFPFNNSSLTGLPIIANNAISFLPGVSGFVANVTNLQNFCNTFKFHYLICKSVTRTGNNVKMEFEAYGKNGEVVIKAFYDNLR